MVRVCHSEKELARVSWRTRGASISLTDEATSWSAMLEIAECLFRYILFLIPRGWYMTANEKAVAEVLSAYNAALNSSDTNAVMPLYATDGVFMPPYSSSAVGAGEVRKAYDAVFKAIKLTVKFNVAEVVEMSPEWVYARTNSAGTTLNHATGVTT
jgi:uncharacterized protein (TIGR02246 family)